MLKCAVSTHKKGQQPVPDLHEAIARDQEHYKASVEAHVTRIVQLLSLQPPQSPAHNVEAYHDGIRIPVTLSSNLMVYIYCLPWARGWSIFTSPHSQDQYSFSWRTITEPWRTYQMPVYCPRDTWGPWNCTPEQITASLVYIMHRLADRSKRRRAALSYRKAQ
jgi:hypothetical protein